MDADIILACGKQWQSTGRKIPEGVKLEIRCPYNTHKHTSPWQDLCWYNEVRDVWVYVATLPAEK